MVLGGCELKLNCALLLHRHHHLYLNITLDLRLSQLAQPGLRVAVCSGEMIILLIWLPSQNYNIQHQQLQSVKCQTWRDVIIVHRIPENTNFVSSFVVLYWQGRNKTLAPAEFYDQKLILNCIRILYCLVNSLCTILYMWCCWPVPVHTYGGVFLYSQSVSLYRLSGITPWLYLTPHTFLPSHFETSTCINKLHSTPPSTSTSPAVPERIISWPRLG